MLVRAVARVVVPDGLRVQRVLEVEDLQPVLVRRHEHVRPADLVIVREVVPVGGPGRDRRVDVLAPCPPARRVRSQMRSGVYWYSVSVTAYLPSGDGVNVWATSIAKARDREQLRSASRGA